MRLVLLTLIAAGLAGCAATPPAASGLEAISWTEGGGRAPVGHTGSYCWQLQGGGTLTSHQLVIEGPAGESIAEQTLGPLPFAACDDVTFDLPGSWRLQVRAAVDATVSSVWFTVDVR